jgi:hypothetical protein
MKEWAEKRRQELEAIGEKELAVLFQLVINICEIEQQLSAAPEV